MKTKNKRYVLTLEAAREDADAVEAGLYAHMDPSWVVITKPEASCVWFELYYEQRDEADEAGRLLGRLPGVRGKAVRVCLDSDWQDFWRYHFKPRPAGNRFMIYPAWAVPEEAPPGRLPLVINPGLSFGTGDHFTTRFCLESLERFVQDGAADSMLDIGTGSGILAIAAVLLGVRHVEGFDVDAWSLEQARMNSLLNGLAESRIVWQHADVGVWAAPRRYDIVCANVFTKLLVTHAEKIASLCGRCLIVTGIKDERESDLVEAVYMAHGLKPILCDSDGEWYGHVFKRENEG